MYWISRFKTQWRAAVGLGMGVLVCLIFGSCSTEPKTKTPGSGTQSLAPVPAKQEFAAAEQPNTNAPVVGAQSRASVPAKREFTGAELYSMNCNRCHAERYPTERTAAQWKTIMLHMRVRANLPADQARIILKYLQENSGR